MSPIWCKETVQGLEETQLKCEVGKLWSFSVPYVHVKTMKTNNLYNIYCHRPYSKFRKSIIYNPYGYQNKISFMTKLHILHNSENFVDLRKCFQVCVVGGKMIG